MPRGPRLDAAGALHHVIARGIERGLIFRDDRDREAFLHRVERLVCAGAFEIYAWALMPNHVHLLLRTRALRVSAAMRCLLTGHAVSFNRRHERVGHLFQNRFKSVLCDEESYFLELVRYIHLNPLKAGIVADVGDLARHRFTGHPGLLGVCRARWQNTRDVLGRFSDDAERARRLYLDFVRAGVEAARDLEGGGLVRSVGGWREVERLRRGREKFEADERVLGSSDFVARVKRSLDGRASSVTRPDAWPLAELLRLVCDEAGASRKAVVGGSRNTSSRRAREGLAYLWIECLGRSGTQLARDLGVARGAIYRAARRGGSAAARWQRLIEPSE